MIHAESGGISFQTQGPETVMCTVFVMNVIGIDGSGECSQRQASRVVRCVCLSVCDLEDVTFRVFFCRKLEPANVGNRSIDVAGK